MKLDKWRSASSRVYAYFEVKMRDNVRDYMNVILGGSIWDDSYNSIWRSVAIETRENVHHPMFQIKSSVKWQSGWYPIRMSSSIIRRFKFDKNKSKYHHLAIIVGSFLWPPRAIEIDVFFPLRRANGQMD